MFDQKSLIFPVFYENCCLDIIQSSFRTKWKNFYILDYQKFTPDIYFLAGQVTDLGHVFRTTQRKRKEGSRTILILDLALLVHTKTAHG